jgi:hypothetical protein
VNADATAAGTVDGTGSEARPAFDGLKDESRGVDQKLMSADMAAGNGVVKGELLTLVPPASLCALT